MVIIIIIIIIIVVVVDVVVMTVLRGRMPSSLVVQAGILRVHASPCDFGGGMLPFWCRWWVP
jgi:hypothetical protein